MSRRMILLLAVTCGVAVGNIYFPQAISPLVASGLHVSPDSASLVVTAAVLAAGCLGGSAGLAALVLGTLALDVAMQSGMVANQVRIYALRPEVLSRLKPPT